INAFNQPDVEASKVETRKLTSEYEATGHLPAESPFFEATGVRLFADERNAAALGGGAKLVDALKKHLARAGAGDYFAVLGYIPMNAENEKILQEFRHAVRDKRKVATCLGFGPRFLHSTGQAYKGGPNSGVFLQVTCDDAADLNVPGQRYTFGVVKAAQARGDFQVLSERGRRALRVHLGKDVAAGLQHARPPRQGRRGVAGDAGQRRRKSTQRLGDLQHATRDDRPRPHGREHGAAPDARRPQVRGVRPRRGLRRGAGQGRRGAGVVARGL